MRIKQIDERLVRLSQGFETSPAYGMKSRFVPNGQRQIDVRKLRLLEERDGLVRELRSECGDG